MERNMVVSFLVHLVVCKRRNGKEINNKFASIPFTIYIYFLKIELKHISSSLIVWGGGGGGGNGTKWTFPCSNSITSYLTPNKIDMP